MKKPRTFLAATVVSAAALSFGWFQLMAGAATNQLTIYADRPGPKMSRFLYGQFAEHLGRGIYEGIWVGENSPIPNTRGIRNDVVAALRKIKVPVLRWPGGCFADEYHWMDGIGPRDQRPARINSHWGRVLDHNHFGTHEFLDLCEQLGAEPYLAVNVGSGSVREMMDWIEYTTSDQETPLVKLRRQNGRWDPWKIRFWGIGNESWGCGGSMRPEFYADLYRQYQEFVRNHGDNRIDKIACGASDANVSWTEVLMERVGRRMDGLSLHYYTIPSGRWNRKGSATRFGEAEWHATLRRALVMDELLRRHSAVMDRFDPQKRIALIVDEWGVWHDVEPGTHPGFLYQQNTLRDALAAAATLNIFHHHADRVRMANIAQMVNVLQAMILTDGPRMLLTPTYHVFEMFVPHQDATFLPDTLECEDYVWGDDRIPALSSSASRDAAGRIHLSLVHFRPDQPTELNCRIEGFHPRRLSGQVLTAPTMQAHNTFDAPAQVRPMPFSDFEVTDQGLRVRLAAKSVVVLTIE